MYRYVVNIVVWDNHSLTSNLIRLRALGGLVKLPMDVSVMVSPGDHHACSLWIHSLLYWEETRSRRQGSVKEVSHWNWFLRTIPCDPFPCSWFCSISAVRGFPSLTVYSHGCNELSFSRPRNAEPSDHVLKSLKLEVKTNPSSIRLCCMSFSPPPQNVK